MVAYSILLNLLLLIGVGCIVGILVAAIMANMKLSTLIKNMSELNKNLSNIKLNNVANNSNDTNLNQSVMSQAQVQKSVVNSVPYKNDLDAHATSFKEEQLIQERINSLQKSESFNEVKKQNTEEIKQNTVETKQSVNRQSSPSVVGIVFCRNCASHFTSDKDACPICGAKR